MTEGLWIWRGLEVTENATGRKLRALVRRHCHRCHERGGHHKNTPKGPKFALCRCVRVTELPIGWIVLPLPGKQKRKAA